MMDRIANGWKMAENHVFQFDFLNDDFSKCPEELQEILNDPEKRKKLVVYINPPYAEAGTGTGRSKSGVTNTNKIYEKYKDIIGKASKELYALFFIRIFKEINGCILGEFSKIKVFQASNFQDFRREFNAKLEKLFIVPGNTFDNVKGEFPIGFFVWNTNETSEKLNCQAHVFDADGNELESKTIITETENTLKINDWLKKQKTTSSETVGVLMADAPDFANQKYVCIINEKTNRHGIFVSIDKNNLIQISIYLAVRHCIEATWLNDRDQFLYPNDGWKNDKEFQTDCLIFTLFHGQNRISVVNCVPQLGKTALPSAGTQMPTVNHWIPFTREQVGCRKTFKSTFMADYLTGKIKTENSTGKLFDFQKDSIQHELPRMNHELSEIGIDENSCAIGGNSCDNNGNTCNRIIDCMSPDAQAVYDAGLALWRYYHSQPNALADASFYDIRLHFQGTNDKGTMNAKSDDETYMELISDLREKMKLLAKRIEAKVYEYGFLK